MNQPILIHPLDALRRDDYLRFFERRAFTDNPRWAGCWCYYPQHDPKTTDWQQRTSDENRAAICACLDAGTVQGWLACREDGVVGWCNAGPRRLYPMLADDPALPPDDGQTGAVFCFVVAPGERRQGIARALLQAACDGLRAQGLRRVLGRPLRHARSDAGNHTGPLALYLANGFAIVHEDSASGEVVVERLLD
jgi:ribosomal protein S18 acetylase RimI-like enzyme